MSFSVRNILITFSLLIVLLMQNACNTKEAVFTEIARDKWYSTKIGGQKVLIQFNVLSEISAEGIAFPDEDKAIVTPGKVKASAQSLEISYNGEAKNYKGKWTISDEKLVFTNKDKKLGELTFTRLPEYSIPNLPDRYKKKVFKSFTKTEVTYGKADGFYTSKQVADMNSGSYADIILDVLNSLGDNLFTTELSLTMDIYMPKGDTVKSRPVLLLIHGGAFIVGDKSDDLQYKYAEHYTSLGYVVASINYRMGYLFIPGMYENLERCIYKAVQDSRAALRFLVHNKTKYGIDPDQIFIAGNSAGGFIALKTAFMAESEGFTSADGNDLFLQDNLGCLDCSGNSYKDRFTLRGVISLWGALTDLEMLDEFEKVPLLLVHGDADKIVPIGYDFPFKNIDEQYTSFFVEKVYGSQVIYNKAKRMKFPVRLYKIPNGSHEPQVDSYNRYTPEMEKIKHEIDSFMLAQLTHSDVKITAYSTNGYEIKNLNPRDKIYWSINGGCILNVMKQGKIKIAAFNTAKKCTLSAAVVASNGSVTRISKVIYPEP